MRLPLLTALLLLTALTVYGQRIPDLPTTDPVPVKRTPRSLAKSVPETIFPPFFDLECSNVGNFVPLGEPEAGFVAGTNSFNDLAKGQRFIYPSAVPYRLLDVEIAFANVDSAALDRSVSVQIFEDLSADSTFGNLLATSDSLLLSELVLPDSLVRYTLFAFPDSVILDRDSFIVVVDFSDTYTDSPQYMTLFTSEPGCGDGKNAFEFYLTQSGIGINTINANWNAIDGEGGLNIELFMQATVEPLETTATRRYTADYGLSISPNPTHDQTRVNFTASRTGAYYTDLLDLHGRTINRQVHSLATGSSSTVEFNTSSLPTGTYLVRITGPGGNQTVKLAVH